MFKFVVAVCLIAITILGWSFYGEYRTSNMTEAQIQAAQLEDAERESAREERAQLRRDALTSTYSQMESPEAKGAWIFVWSTVVLMSIAGVSMFFVFRKKVLEPIWYGR